MTPMGWLDAVYVMAYRQLKHFVRSPSRITASIVNPLIWILFFGMGWASTFRFPGAKALFGGVDYLSFLIPGIIAMSVFTGSFLSGISILFDKQFGFLKEILVAPVPRVAAMTGRILGDSLTATIEAGIIAVIGLPLITRVSFLGILYALLYSYLAAIGFSALGIAIASRMRSYEGFQLIMSFLIMPLIFLSGAFYPIRYMPWWLKLLAYMDPLTYSVDATRYWLVGVAQINPWIDLGALLLLDAGLVIVAGYLFGKMSLE